MKVKLKDDASALVFEDRDGLEATKFVAKLTNDRGETEEVEIELGQISGLYGKHKLTEAGEDMAAKKTKRIRELREQLDASADPDEIKRLNQEIADVKDQLETAKIKAKQDAAEDIKAAKMEASTAKAERDAAIKRYRDSQVSSLVSEAAQGLVAGAAQDARALLIAEYGIEWESPEDGQGEASPVVRIPVEQKGEDGEPVTVKKKMSIPEAVKHMAEQRPQWQPASNGGAGGAGGRKGYSPGPGERPPSEMSINEKIAYGLSQARK